MTQPGIEPRSPGPLNWKKFDDEYYECIRWRNIRQTRYGITASDLAEIDALNGTTLIQQMFILVFEGEKSLDKVDINIRPEFISWWNHSFGTV